MEHWSERFIFVLNYYSGMPSDELENEAASIPLGTQVFADELSLESVFDAIKHLRIILSVWTQYSTGQGKCSVIGRMEFL